MEMVVIVKLPLCVVGIPAYIYCMLLLLFTVRLAFKSIFKSGIGSNVALSWRSSMALVVAGVLILSLLSSHPRSLALSI